MSARFSFQLGASDPRLRLPYKLILGQEDTQTAAHVLLKLLGFLLFFRERLQIEPSLHEEDIPFRPDLVQFDYQLRAALWVECGECTAEKLDRLAVKVPEAELWVLKGSLAEAEALAHSMARHGLRRNRYRLLAFDAAFMEELATLLTPRNRVFWVRGTFDPPNVQFEFNGLWFDTDFAILPF